MVILTGIVALILGTFGGYRIRATIIQKKTANAEAEAEAAIKKAKEEGQELLLQAKKEAISILEQGKKEETERQQELRNAQKRLEERENRFEQRLNEIDKKQQQLDQDKQILAQQKEQIAAIEAKAQEELQRISGLTVDQAQEAMFQIIEEDHKEALLGRVRKMDQETEEELEQRSKRVLSLAIARFAGSHVVDATTTMVELPSDDMKGRIIGREGRNIKHLEHLTGCELIIDDTPQMITISGFSPVRRQIAKIALEILIKDGRIQPARIEEAVTTAKKDLAKEMKKAGEEALIELGIPVSSIDPKLVSILGRLKYRTSYGQNVLQHSIEVARISGMIAAELGANVFDCKKGGLFHDIGKAVDHDMQGAHPEIGYNIMKKFGFPEELCYQSIAHHEDKPRTLEGVIVKAADAISGARPGARRNNLEDYIQRLQNLEATAMEFEGVEKAYAIQAGREVRVFVEPTAIDDYGAYKLAKQISKKIENDLTYPGEVKVTIIRETRVSEYAR